MFPEITILTFQTDTGLLGDINRLTDKCVVVGYPDDFFKPNQFVTRAEMAAMVVKGFNLESTAMTAEGNFSDVPYSHWAI